MKPMRIFAAFFASLLCLGALTAQEAGADVARPPHSRIEWLPSPRVIAERVRERLVSFDRLDVEATCRVTYAQQAHGEFEPKPVTNVREIIRTAPEATTVVAHVKASMTKDSFQALMSRENETRPLLDISLSVVDGSPTITERHWYPQRNEHREIRYASPCRTGTPALELESSLFAGIGTVVCSTAEFYTTWLKEEETGEYHSTASAFCMMIGMATEVEEVQVDGRRAYRLTRHCYRNEETDRFTSRRDSFLVDAESSLVVRWSKEFVDMRYGTAAGYKVVDTTYRYPG